MEPLVFPNVLTPSPGVSRPAGSVAVSMKSPTSPQTLAALFEEEESGLLRFAIGLVRRRTVAEELVQETFLRLHQVWSQVENPRAWLYRSLRNLALNHLRDHRAETELNEENTPPHDDGTPPADELGRMEAIGIVKLLLAEMPEDDRRLVQLKYHDELKYEEISRRTGMSVGNIGYKLHHLLKDLADALRRAGVEGSRG
jgi:RNA polymerase sigma-70 factor (ECF subfamily)